MKQLIVMLASIMLGLAIFTMIAGSDDSSIYSNVKGVWRQEIELRSMDDHAHQG